MATEKQYQFFKALYDEESKRYEQLESRAKLYITILTFYLAAIAFKLDDVLQFFKLFSIPRLLAVVAGLAFVSALLSCVIAILIRSYETPVNPEALLNSLPSSPPSDEDFFDDRIVDYAVATNHNSDQNDRAANALQIAGWLLVVGVALHVAIFSVALAK
jgi:hypothetical protein